MDVHASDDSGTSGCRFPDFADIESGLFCAAGNQRGQCLPGASDGASAAEIKAVCMRCGSEVSAEVRLEYDNTQVEGSDCVILDRNMTKAGYQGEDLWKYYQTYETIPWGYIRTMHVIYENDDFILYVK